MIDWRYCSKECSEYGYAYAEWFNDFLNRDLGWQFEKHIEERNIAVTCAVICARYSPILDIENNRTVLGSQLAVTMLLDNRSPHSAVTRLMPRAPEGNITQLLSYDSSKSRKS